MVTKRKKKDNNDYDNDDDSYEYEESEYEEENEQSEEYEDDDIDDEDELDNPDDLEMVHLSEKRKNQTKAKVKTNEQKFLNKKRQKDNENKNNDKNDYVKQKGANEHKPKESKVKDGKTKENKPKTKKIIDNKNNNDLNLEEIDANTPYNIEQNYFLQPLNNYQWNKISLFIEKSLTDRNLSRDAVNNFFLQFPFLYKGEENITKLLSILNNKASKTKNALLSSYQIINSYIISNYLMPKPSIFEVHFFPNPENEIYVLKMLSTCKQSMDIAIFTMTNWKIAKVIENLFLKGIKLRIIADDECCKMWGSNIYQLAALGIPVKTDDSVRYHMHHKFAVIDESVVITGSFNWTSQAVEHNQENVLFIENKALAKAYSDEFQRLWEYFEVVITKDNARRIIQEQEDKKKATEMRKLKEKMNKDGDNNNINKKLLDEQEKKNKMEEKKLRDMKITEGRFNRVENRNLLYDNITINNTGITNNNVIRNELKNEIKEVIKKKANNNSSSLFNCFIF